MKTKRFCAILMLAVMIIGSAAADGFFPDLNDVYGTPMPSLGDVLCRYPDEVNTLPDGSSEQHWSGVSDADFEAFGDYLSASGASLLNYTMTDGVFESTVGKDGMTFEFTYDASSHTAVVTYPAGTFDERLFEAEARYNRAADLQREGEYSEALAQFTSIRDYEAYRDVGTLLAADEGLAAAAAQTERLAQYGTVGSIVTYGRFEQDNSSGNGAEPIEWIVLDYDEAGHRSLLISRYGLDARPYHSTQVNTTWERCSLRTWLNDSFLNTAFTDDEQTGILLTDVDNSRSQGNSAFNSSGGSNTQDRIFLLSYAEFGRYFSGSAGKCAPTDYATAKGAKTGRANNVDGRPACVWWLRSPGSNNTYASCVRTGGNRFSAFVNTRTMAVRPAFWLDLTAAANPYVSEASAAPQPGATPAPTDTPAPSATPRPTARSVLPGNVITFGRYEQDNSSRNGPEPIEWYVLEYNASTHRALLLACHGLDCRPYNDTRTDITWDRCTLRTWLNNQFFYNAFFESERAAIVQAHVPNDHDTLLYNRANIRLGSDTDDRVFLLSESEACMRVPDNWRMCRPTAYARGRGAGNIWWLRSPGYYQYYASTINENGWLSNGGNSVTYNAVSIRPAIWVNLLSDCFN